MMRHNLGHSSLYTQRAAHCNQNESYLHPKKSLIFFFLIAKTFYFILELSKKISMQMLEIFRT